MLVGELDAARRAQRDGWSDARHQAALDARSFRKAPRMMEPAECPTRWISRSSPQVPASFCRASRPVGRRHAGKGRALGVFPFISLQIGRTAGPRVLFDQDPEVGEDQPAGPGLGKTCRAVCRRWIRDAGLPHQEERVAAVAGEVAPHGPGAGDAVGFALSPPWA